MSGPAARMRLLRQRAREHRAIVQVEIDLTAVGADLIDRHLLRLEQAEDREAIGAAIGKQLENLLLEPQLRRDA